MEAAEGAPLRQRGKTEVAAAATTVAAAAAAAGAGDTSRGPPLSGTSYWLDVWLLIFFDLVLFVFVYLLP